MNFRNFIMVFILFSLFSCGNQKKEDVAALLKTWSGKEILFPANPVFTVQGKDTIDFPMLGKYKILTYVDSIGCISCKLQLGKWKTFMEEVDSVGMNSARFLFFFTPEKRRDLLITLKSERFTYPICIDRENRLNELNNFPTSDMNFHTFLLDRDNKVIAIGNPIHNPKVRELYLQIIKGERVGQEDASKVVRTTVDIDRTYALLGNFDWQKEQNVSFVLKNTGKQPLVIEYVKTSCGCTSVDYSKEPVQPGKEIQLNVTYKAEHPEHFNKTITVYCNTETSPITLKISGDAK